MLVKQLEELYPKVEAATADLARSRQLADSYRQAVMAVRDVALASTPTDDADVDPYLLDTLHRGLLDAWSALDTDDPTAARRRGRVALEKVRVTIRDITEGAPVAASADTADIIALLARLLAGAGEDDIASLLDVSRRTWQRWRSGQASPSAADERRLRAVARASSHLRHSLTAAGTAAWFDRQHPALDGHRPAELVGDPLAAEQVVAQAATQRATIAA